MKKTFLFISTIIIVIFGCTKSQIKDSLKAHFRTNQYTTATIFPINLKDKKFAECVQEKLKDDLKYLKFVPGEKFREALFPWFEPNTAPKTIEELSILLTKPMVKKRIESLGVELLIYVHGHTKMYDEANDGSPFCLVHTYQRETHIWTTVWDIKEIVRLGDTDISYEGTVVLGAFVILPIIHPVLSESSACNETAKRISNCLKGKDSSTDK